MKKMVIMALGLTFTGYAQQPSSMERDTLGLEEVVITANRIDRARYVAPYWNDWASHGTLYQYD